MRLPRLPTSLVLLLGAGILLSDAVPAAAGAAERQPRPPQRARFEAPVGGSLLVHGEYPPVRSSCARPSQPLLHARYRGAIEVGRASDGSLFVIGETPFEEYLQGIAEVPRSWALAALKAQVVAARSYAMVQLDRGSPQGRTLGYDLCATDACQVYAGMGVEAGPWGERWVRAVEETRGEVLLHAGKPAETFYFSTSNGRTYSNQEVWGGEPLPYLPGVRENDDGQSPLSRWRLEVSLDDLTRFLRHSGRWSDGPIEGATVRDGQVVLRGERRVRLSKEDLRTALNGSASCLVPDRYPQPDEEGYRPPQTVPSIWYDLRQRGRSVVLEGRGWGHGIGLVQWGAKGKADRGLSYADILAAYYGGLRPRRVDSPGTIRVLIAQGLRSVTVTPSDGAEVRIGDRSWRARRPFRVEPIRQRIRMRPASVPDPVLRVDGLRVRRAPDGAVTAAATASRNVRARVEVLRDGEVVAAGSWQPKLEGRFRLTAGAPDVPGDLAVRVRASDGVDTVVTPTRGVAAVPGPEAGDPSPAAAPSPTASPSPTVQAAPGDGGRGTTLPLAVAGVVAGAVALLVLTVGRRRRLHRGR